jgi:hypothetical protein
MASRRVIVLMLFVALLATAAAAGLAAAAPASASIIDMDAWPDGTVIFENTGSEYAQDVAIVGGYAYAAGAASGPGGWDASLLKVSLTTGAKSRFQTTLAAGDSVFQLAVAPGGKAIYTAGRISSPEDDVFLVKWSKAGGILWKRHFDVAPGMQDSAVDLTTDGFGNVTVAASARGTYGYDWAVVSWTASGQRRWVWRYSGAGHRDDFPDTVVADRNGNVYVTGDAYVSATVPSIVTVKLSPRGRRIWSKAYAGASGQGAHASSMVACPTGGVYVGGYAVRGSAADALVVRYAPSGARKVFAPYPGSGTSSISLNDIAVLTSGRVVGVGSARSGGMSDPYAIAWTPQGAAVWATSPWTTYWGDQLVHVAADPYGAFVTSGYRATGEDDRVIVTWRVKPFAPGAQWRYDWAGPTVAEHTVGGLAVKGGVVAIAGSCYSDTTASDHFVQYWVY